MIVRKYIYASWQSGVSHETIRHAYRLGLYLRINPNYIVNIGGDVVMRIAIFGLVFMASSFIVFGALGWISKTPEPIAKPEMAICKIIIPIGRMQSGWKLWDPADDGHVSNLVRNNKAEIIHLPGLVECTVYIDNQTPVTTPGALAMWRRR